MTGTTKSPLIQTPVREISGKSKIVLTVNKARHPCVPEIIFTEFIMRLLFTVLLFVFGCGGGSKWG